MPINPELRRLGLQDGEFQAKVGDRGYESCRIEDTIGLRGWGGRADPSMIFKYDCSSWF